MEEEPNSRLAKDYWDFIKNSNPGRSFWCLVIYRNQREAIRKTSENIEEYYRKNSSLKGLSVKGVGKKTKIILERILADESFLS